MRHLTVYILFLTAILIGCATTGTSVLTGASYDKNTDQTTYILVPYGNVTFPGQWTKTHYNQSSTQQFFRRNSDSTTFAVTKAEKTFYSFYLKGQTDFEFVNAFYKWESDYRQQQGYKTEKIKQDTTDNFITWRLSGKEGWENYFLYGYKNGRVYNLLMASKKLSGEDMTAFLENVYKKN